MRIDMTETRRRNAPNSMPQYEDEESLLPSGHKEKEERWSAKRRRESESSEPSVLLILFTFAMIFLFLFGLVYWIVYVSFHQSKEIYYLSTAADSLIAVRGFL